MPIYEFQCRNLLCAQTPKKGEFQIYMSLALYDAQKAQGFNRIQCPTCSTSRNVESLLSIPSVHGATIITLPPGDKQTPPELEGREFKSWAEVGEAKANIGLLDGNECYEAPRERKTRGSRPTTPVWGELK